jgi:hypothetical protein
LAGADPVACIVVAVFSVNAQLVEAAIRAVRENVLLVLPHTLFR